jgi:hypothetical protein
VEADRQQIAAVIQQLDDKKRAALEATWKKARRPLCGRPGGVHAGGGGVAASWTRGATGRWLSPPFALAPTARTCTNKNMQNTRAQVTESFGAIFSSLLPGTEARLVPPEGLTFLDGGPGRRRARASPLPVFPFLAPMRSSTHHRNK